MKPCTIFSESPVPNAFTMAKSMLIDFFRGETTDKIDVEALRFCVVVTADEPTTSNGTTNGSSSSSSSSAVAVTDPSSAPVLRLRVYAIRTRRSGQRLPRVELEEHGPRMDFRLGRIKEPDEALLKEAMRRPKTTEERTKKNISTDAMGDKIGRIHVGKLDLGALQTRKMKGLKRSRDQRGGGDADHDDDGGDDGDGTVVGGDSSAQPAKRKRKVKA